MCAICGILQFDGLKPTSEKLIKKMTDKMIHRGPDKYGYHEDEYCALGFRRLSIIDLNTGDQPIGNEDSTIWVVLNGEIYNFQELRKLLEKEGHQFHTKTDTEVILHAYEQFGIKFLEMLRGMFAIALWDSKNRKLLLARDRLGKKPLYYAINKSGILFGSEIKALVQSPDVAREIDLQGLDQYLVYGYVPSPQTILKGVNKLSPGSYLSLSILNRKIEINQYWNMNFNNKIDYSEVEATERLRKILTEAVRIRMYSDVPLGSLLSGGIDSTIITGLMAQSSNKPIMTFSIGFNEFDYNELPYARLVAKKFGTNHHEFVIKPDIKSIIPQIIYYLDEPMDDSSVIPTFCVSKIAKQNVTVVLNGDGGDETFSGYTRYGEMLSLLRFSKIVPKNINKIIRTIVADVPENIDICRILSRTRTFTEINNISLSELVLRSYQKWSSKERSLLYRPDVLKSLKSLDTIAAEDEFITKFSKNTSYGMIDQMLAIDNQMYLPNDLLVKMDRMSMANSLEARSPFLDQDVFEFASQLPEQFKRKNKNGKIILRKVFQDLIPKEILKRSKKGFRIPLKLWFKNELKEMLYDELLSSNSRNSSFYQPKIIEKKLNEHISGLNDHSNLIWGLLVFELWQKQIIDN